MRPIVLSRAGILPWRHDNQLCSDNRMRGDNFPGLTPISGLHQTLDQREDLTLDGFRDHPILIARAALV
jgi:hypothetical protein